MDWFLLALKKYATFSGRSQRAEYWYFFLFYVLIGIGLSFVDYFLGLFDAVTEVGLLSGAFSLAVLIPSIAVAVRRLHDISRTGWWLLIGFIPVVGTIVLLVFLVLDSTPGDNAYGPNPKIAAT